MKDIVYSLHRDLEDAHWWFVGRRRLLSPLIREAMRGAEQDLIVDIGCGTGGTVAALSSEFRCFGIDSSQQAIEIAKAKYPGCEFVCSSIPDALAATAPETALYLLMDVLEHMDADRRFLDAVTRSTRPGGHILITVPAKPILWSQHDVEAGHKRRYEIDTLARLWKDLPVRSRVISYFNTRLYPLIWAVRVIGRRIGLDIGKGGSDFSMPPFFLNKLLTRILADEQTTIRRLLTHPSAKPYETGVSLLALLQRTA